MFLRSITGSLITLAVLASCTKTKEEDPLQKGLIAHYPFNGNANDESGNNYHLTIHDATMSNDRFGAASRSFHFDGQNDYLQMPAIEKSAGLQELTISLWIKPERASPYILSLYGENFQRNGCLSYLGTYSKQNGYGLQHTLLSKGSPSCPGRTMIDSATNTLDEWTHLVLVQHPDKDNIGSFLRYTHYNNGKKSQLTQGQTSDYGPLPTNFQFGGFIGAYIRPDIFLYQGNIDDIRIYNRRLSDAEVLELYHLKK